MMKPEERNQLFQPFESLGNNCEFGIVQRKAGFDPPGLFRNVGFLDIGQMTRAIRDSFSGMFEEGNYIYDIRAGWPDYTLICSRFGFSFHSGIPVEVEPGTPEWEHQQQKRIMGFRFLKTKLLGDLATGEKTFVCRSKQKASTAAIRDLYAAVRSHGPGWLLYVQEATDRPSGWTSLIDDGLILGIVSHLSNENPPRIDFPAWEAVAKKAYLIRFGANGLPPAWRSPGADSAGTSEILPPAPGLEVLAHRLTATASGAAPIFHYVVEGSEPEATYLAMAWIYLDASFRGSDVGLAILGRPSLRFVKADLRERNRWQQMWVIARGPKEQSQILPSLLVKGEANSLLYTAGWDFGCFKSTAELPSSDNK